MWKKYVDLGKFAFQTIGIRIFHEAYFSIQLVDFKQQTKLKEKRQQALDQHLSFIVDKTEKYSSLVAESMNKSALASIQDTSRAHSPDENSDGMNKLHFFLLYSRLETKKANCVLYFQSNLNLIRVLAMMKKQSKLKKEEEELKQIIVKKSKCLNESLSYLWKIS